MNCIAWDYEETDPPYYHIYTPCGPLDGLVSSITIDVDLTAENTKDVELIIAALERIASRIT